MLSTLWAADKAPINIENLTSKLLLINGATIDSMVSPAPTLSITFEANAGQ